MEQRQILSHGRFDGGYLTASFVAARLAEHAPLTAAAASAVEQAAYGATALGVGVPVPKAQGLRGDNDLNPGHRLPREGPLVPAAVLVPLIEHAGGLTVMLTQRTAHLTKHAGQISFPGGRIEPDDRDALAAALRETYEEVGLPGDRVRALGRLDTYITGTGYSITPTVGLIQPPYPLDPHPGEVAEVFEVPLAFIVDPANHERHSAEWNGATRTYFVLPYENRHIWGATAGMLVNLAHLLAP